MGCGYDFACKTCKKSYYLGYGSYSTWMTLDTLADFDAVPEFTVTDATPNDQRTAYGQKSLRKNQNIRRCLEEHDGHDHMYVGWDWSSIGHTSLGEVRGALYSDLGPYGASYLEIEDYAEYERIDLAPDPPPEPEKPFTVPLNADVDAKLTAWTERQKAKV